MGVGWGGGGGGGGQKWRVVGLAWARVDFGFDVQTWREHSTFELDRLSA